MSTCHFCPSIDARIEGNHWDGSQYVRVSVCDVCYASKALKKAPPRRRQAVQLPATDWNMLVAFSRKGTRP